METKYYIVGKRPVKREIKEKFDIYYEFQLDTGEFKENMRYNQYIQLDFSGDVTEVSKLEFDEYIKKLKQELGL